MPFWLLLLIVLGGLLIFALIFDWVAKKKKLKIDLQNGVKNASDSERIYTEKALDETRQRMGNDVDNW